MTKHSYRSLQLPLRKACRISKNKLRTRSAMAKIVFRGRSARRFFIERTFCIGRSLDRDFVPRLVHLDPRDSGEKASIYVSPMEPVRLLIGLSARQAVKWIHIGRGSWIKEEPRTRPWEEISLVRNQKGNGHSKIVPFQLQILESPKGPSYAPNPMTSLVAGRQPQPLCKTYLSIHFIQTNVLFHTSSSDLCSC